MNTENLSKTIKNKTQYHESSKILVSAHAHINLPVSKGLQFDHIEDSK